MMKSLAQRFLTPVQQKEITDAVHAAESRTSGEIVPLIVSESHAYPMAAVRGGILLSLPLALLLTGPVAAAFWASPTSMWVFLFLMFPLFWFIALTIQNIPRVKRLFVLRREMAEEVPEAAHVAFFTEGLYKTKSANGVLLFISLFEHQAWVIADSGINDRIAAGEWEEAVSLVVRGVKEKNQAEAICGAIQEIGDILEKEFPIQEDDENELHDLIIR